MLPSLRLSLIAGLVVLQTVVLAGVSFSVYERSRTIAHTAMQNDLELRARTLAGSVEIDGGKIEMELEQSAAPEYFTHGASPFMFIADHEGERAVQSPSLGDEVLRPDADWQDGAMIHADVESGPFGMPCATVTHSFLVRLDGVDKGDDDDDEDGKQGWPGLTDEERRYQVKVAMDSRARDEPLVALGWFLALVDLAALAVTLLGGYLLARVVLRPVATMTDEAGQLSARDPERRLVPSAMVQELRVLADTLNAAFDRLTGALDRQRRFTADAGHELRTPVSILLSNADLLLRRERTVDEYVEGLALQRRTCLRMQSLVEDLLYLARADSNTDELQLSEIEVGALLDALADEFAPLAETRDVAIRVVCASPVSLRCDERAAKRVLRNLVSNALKFSPEGGEVELAATRTGGRAVVTVSDAGPGIPPRAREHVFERFFRVNDGRDTSEGTGLGLAIARSIVVAHEGTIRVERAPAGGTRFVVEFPGARVAESSERDHAFTRVASGTG